MRNRRTLFRGAVAVVSLLAALPAARAGWSVGVHLGFPAYRPCYHPPHCYRPYPFYYRPAPVILEPVRVVRPVYVAPAAPVPAPADNWRGSAETAPAPRRLPAIAVSRDAETDRFLRQLHDPDEQNRVEAATQLGRMRATSATGALAGALNNDRSPLVRDAAARALGLIGSQDSLAVLQRAALADEDRDVRRSAGYAADVIRARPPR